MVLELAYSLDVVLHAGIDPLGVTYLIRSGLDDIIDIVHYESNYSSRYPGNDDSVAQFHLPVRQMERSADIDDGDYVSLQIDEAQ